MKRHLERHRDKMTPEEERRIWSKMRDGLRGEESRRSSWVPRLWLSRAAVAAAAVLAAAVIWHADLLTPDRVVKKDVPVFEARSKAGSQVGTEAGAQVSAQTGTQVGTETGAQAPTKVGDQALTEPGPQAQGEAQATLAPVDMEGAAEPRANDSGVMMKVPPEKRVYEEAREAAKPEAREPAKSMAGEATSPEEREATEAVTAEKKKVPMPKTNYYEEEDASAVRRSADESSRRDRAAANEAPTTPAAGLEGRSAAKAPQVAGPGEIRGRVTDAAGNPVHDATITIVGTRFGAMTDDKGLFEIRNVPAGTFSLLVSATGYAELTVPGVVVEKGQTYDAKTLALAPEGGAVQESAEQEYRAPMSFNPMSPPQQLQADRILAGRAVGMREKGARWKKRYPSLTGGSRPVNDELADDMFFRHYGTNPFIDAEEDALSTFALDVDTGSYTICRRYINEGHLPPPEAVRVEEFVNFFVKDFPPPRHGDFAIYVDGMPSPFAHVQDGSYRLIRVGIRGRVIDDRHRKPAQIVLVIDTSGSMGMGVRLPLLKESMKVLLDELRADDEIGIVEFGTKARVVLPLTPLSEEGEIYRAVDSLHPNGSTNAEHGLKLGYKMMRREAREGWIHRIIFCSDGVANVGNTGWESILESVRRDSDEISLSTIGFGMGNYNDILMEQLADAGDGQYAYVDDMREAKRVLRENLTGTLQTIAKETKAQIEFNPKYVAKYRLLGYENRDVRDEDFRNDEVDAGEIGSGHEVTVLYEVKLKSSRGRGRAATVRLRYEKPDGGEIVEMEEPFRTRDLWREIEGAPADLVVDACVAEFAEILRHSYWAKDGSLEDVLDLLDETAERMTSRPELDELMRLVKKAIALQDSGERPRRDYREE